MNNNSLRRAFRLAPLILCLFLLGLVSPPVAAKATSSPSVEKKIEEGRKHLRKKRFGKAVAAFGEANELAEGSSADALRLLALASRRVGEEWRAMEASLLLFRLAPDGETTPIRYLVETYGKTARFEELSEVLVEFLEATRDVQRQIWGHNALGYWEEQRSEALGIPPTDDTVSAFRTAFSLSQGKSMVVRLNLAEVLFHQGQTQEVLELIDGVGSSKKGHDRGLDRLLRSEELGSLLYLHLGHRSETSLPMRISCRMPQYPEEARQARIQGSVTLSLWVDETGHPHFLAVRKGLPMGLTEAAIEALLSCRFEPARDEAGSPVGARTEYTTTFTVK